MRAARARRSCLHLSSSSSSSSASSLTTTTTIPRRWQRALPAQAQAQCRHYASQGPEKHFNHFVGAPLPKAVSTTNDGNGDGFRLAVKDNIATVDFPTQCASRILEGFVTPNEATIVRQLRTHGAVVVGKTNLDEFGMGSHSTNSVHGPVRSPLVTPSGEPLSAGGSSGGSAVAIVTGDADLALGTDTGGSIRLPAAFTGIVGLRPSYGMLSRHGVVAYAHSLDTVGLLARDARRLRNLLVDTRLEEEHDPKDPTSLPPAARRRCVAARPSKLDDCNRLTIGLPREYNIAELDPAIRAAWASAAAALEAAGATVVPVSLPTTRQALSAYYVIAAAEASSNMAKYDGVRYGAPPVNDDGDGHTLYAETRGAGLGPEVRRRILLGTFSLSSAAMDNYFVQAQRVRRLVRRDFDRVFRLDNPLCGGGGDGKDQDPQNVHFDLCDEPEDTPLVDKRGPAQVDFLLSPTTPSLPPRLADVLGRVSLDAYMDDVFTVPASLAGLPAVSIPAPGAAKRGGMPVGLQLIGQYWDDRRLLAMADRLMTLMAGEGQA